MTLIFLSSCAGDVNVILAKPPPPVVKSQAAIDQERQVVAPNTPLEEYLDEVHHYFKQIRTILKEVGSPNQ